MSNDTYKSKAEQRMTLDFQKDTELSPDGNGSQYQFVANLGEGATGRVFLFKDTSDGSLKAVKTVPDIIIGTKKEESSVYKALKREYDSLKGLRHEGIVAVQNWVEDEFHCYIVMDYAEGETLEKYLASHRTPSRDVVFEVVKCLASALDYAHVKGMIHCDVKPANIMVDIEEETVKSVQLLDFGLSREIRKRYQMTTGMGNDEPFGTLHYMPPEQWDSKRYGEPSSKSDQYSLAAVAYEMLSGEYPYRDVSEFREAVLNENIHPKRIDKLSGMNDVLQIALSKRPEHRFENCMVFVDVLKAEASKLSDSDKPGNGSNEIDETISGGSLSFSLSEDVALEMIRIPAGKYRNEFSKGGQFEVKNNFDYWIGKFPVTQEQFIVMTGYNPSCFTENGKNPVENLTQEDAENFCRILNYQLASQLPKGYHFAIPTVNHWEYACSAGIATTLNNGENLITMGDGSSPNLNELGWYSKNSGGKTHPVGQKRPNAWGLYDMHGNVKEYCFYGGNRYGHLERHLDWEIAIPNMPSNQYVIMGGGYKSNAKYCQILGNGAIEVGGYQRYDRKSTDIGLRLVLVSDDAICRTLRSIDEEINDNRFERIMHCIWNHKSDTGDRDFWMPLVVCPFLIVVGIGCISTKESLFMFFGVIFCFLFFVFIITSILEYINEYYKIIEPLKNSKQQIQHEYNIRGKDNGFRD